MTRQPTWHAETIKAELRRRFGAVTKLSLAWGYARNGISGVLHDATYSIPLERRISAALGVQLHVLWPDRWASDGLPKPRKTATREAKTSAPRQSPHRQIRDAA